MISITRSSDKPMLYIKKCEEGASAQITYKGVLEQDKLVIAIKVFNLMRRGASKSFLAEWNVRHRNLVKVLTVCSSIDYAENDFEALVSEFMENGSLHDWLHPHSEPNSRFGETTETLNLIQRLDIAIDVACALEYVHSHFGTPIIHDLKPRNVLLDKEMVAHVSDFGLAKFLSDATLHPNTCQSTSTRDIGTIGYCPPEHSLGSDASTAGDVFSFGILLLEIFTGKSPIDDIFIEELSLHNFVKKTLPGKVIEIIDLNLHCVEESSPSYSCNLSSKGNNGFTVSLIAIFKVGICCSSESPQNRPNIGDVVAQLSIIKKLSVKRGL